MVVMKVGPPERHSIPYGIFCQEAESRGEALGPACGPPKGIVREHAV
jgi:hypothetical protein